jgi:tetratricopeptide (TPR) repeat protein
VAFREYVALLVELEDFESGIELLEPLSGEGQLEEGGEITLGQLYYRAGRVDDAIGLFKRLAERKGARPFILGIIADIEMERGNLKSSYTYRMKAIEAEPDTFSHYVGLLMLTGGLAGEASGPHETLDIPDEEVREYFERAGRAMDGASGEDNYLLGLLHRRHGNLDPAERYLLEAERLLTDDRRTAMELASLFEDRGEYDEALARIIPQYEKNPDDASLMNFYGYLLAEKEADLERAEELLRGALQQEPENGYFLDSLGWIKFKQEEYGRALEILLRAVDLVDDDPVIWAHLGDAYRALNRIENASDAYQRSLEIDPDDTGVREKVRLLEGVDQ